MSYHISYYRTKECAERAYVKLVSERIPIGGWVTKPIRTGPYDKGKRDTRYYISWD
ncbi:MAG: hypothetical protein WC175_03320 [Candidatus Dojkabacteria bacterium]